MVSAELDAALEAAIGNEERTGDQVSAPLARRLAATLNRPVDGLEDGAALPDGWHVILFGPTTPTRELGPDGHPRTGAFLPKLPLPRRMFAGRKVFFESPLVIGETVERVSTISDGVVKEGRSGTLAFVTVTHDIMADDTLRVREEQTVVYRGEPKPGASKPPRAPEPPPDDCAWRGSALPDPALLLRYSAITFNAHRIHYDEAYTRDVEGYPGLVVNGGLTAILLIEMARDALSGAALAEFGVTNRRALHAGHPVTLLGQPEPDAPSARLWAVDHEGAVASEASLKWRNP